MAFPSKAIYLVYDYRVKVHIVESTGAELKQEVGVGSGARGVPPGRLGKSGRVPWVPRLPLSSAPLPATPIDAVGGVPRVVLVLFLVPPSWVEEPTGLVTGRWPLEYYLKEFNSVSDYTLKYRQHETSWQVLCSVKHSRDLD